MANPSWYPEFWRHNQSLLKSFHRDSRSAPLLLMFDELCLLQYLKVPSAARYFTDFEYKHERNAAFSTLLEEELGIPPDIANTMSRADTNRVYFEKYHLEGLLGCAIVPNENSTPWVMPAVGPGDSLEALADRIAEVDVGGGLYTDEFRRAEKLLGGRGIRLEFHPSMTGPVTIASHVLGTTGLCTAIMDHPVTMDRFFGILAAKFIAYHDAAESHRGTQAAPSGIRVNDDNCFLFSPDQYRRFCVPFMTRAIDHFAPLPDALRRHHSDSSMAHIMPILNDLGFNEVNLGPDIPLESIRRVFPRAVIHGHTPPMLLRNGTEDEIGRSVRHDLAVAREHGGIVLSPAGVVAAGTPFGNLRLLMELAAEYSGIR